MRIAVKIVVISLAAGLIMFCIFVFSVYRGAFGRLPSQQELLSYRGATASLVMSGEGEIAGRFFYENRTYVNFRQVPEYLVAALIATEDVRFYRHKGVDLRSILRVAVRSVILNDSSSGGGSTISQQLAKNIYGREEYGLFSLLVNKTKEILLAYRIERTFGKDEILTLYLNTVSFGENVYGIEAASRRYYNKRVEQLTLDEAAVLVGMLKANTFYNPRMYPENALMRRNVVIGQMARYGFINDYEADSLTALPLALNYLNLEAVNPAGYFLVRVKREAEEILGKIEDDTGRIWNLEEDGLIINTTLSLKLQNFAVNSFRSHMPLMQKRLRDQYEGRQGDLLLSEIAQWEMRRLNKSDRARDTVFMRIFDWEGSYNKSLTVMDSLRQALTLLHAGLVAIDPSTGGIISWVGGIDFLTQPYDQVTARRQMASAFKPVIYAAALEKGISPCQYFDNDSIVLEEYDNWTPVNYDHGYGGQYSLAGALSRSMNVPTYHIYEEVGFDAVEDLWRAMGFSFVLNNSPALALGTAEASVLETAVAYSAFANGGYRVNPYSIVSITTSDGEVIYSREQDIMRARILSGETAMLMGAMLEKAVNEGTGASMRNAYNVTIPLAGKTGTSQNYADAWFAGFNPSVVMVSRVGASNQTVHFNSGAFGSGSALALPLVALTLHPVQRDRSLAGQLSSHFPVLPYGFERYFDCPDYREPNFMDRFFDRFRRDDFYYEEEEQDFIPRRRSLIRRIFRRNR
jgi:penicillin-binding protein 1A